MAKKKEWTYYTSGVVTLPDGNKESFRTLLNKVSVYIVWNESSNGEHNIKPADLKKMCKKIEKDLTDGKLINVQWGSEITVSQDDFGFLEEVQ